MLQQHFKTGNGHFPPVPLPNQVGFGKVKDKAKLCLCLIRHHATETYGAGGKILGILYLATRWGQVV